MRATKVLFWLAQLAGVAATIWLLWGSDVPLGVPNEWTWDRIQFDDAAFKETAWGWGIAGLATVGYLLFCLFADRRVLEANRWEMTGWLAALVIAGATWHSVVQECPPEPHRLNKVGWVIWYHGFQGYYEEAKGRASQEPDYLAKYAERMREGDVLHFGTHPPGFILLHKSIIATVRRFPKLQEWLLEYQPDSVREGIQIIAENSARTAIPLTDVDRAALWLSGLLAALAAMSTVVPLFFLARQTCGREVAWRAVCLWPLIPALAVFHPVSDLWLPFFATSFLAVWGRAWSQRSIAAGLLAGLVMFLGMMLSLAMLPIAFLAALWTLADCAFGEAIESFGTRVKELAQCVAAALATFVVCVGLTWWLYSLDLPSVWMQNFHNHAGFYAKYPRTFSSWLLVNPIELALAAGTPVFLFAASSWLTSTKGCLRSGRSLASFRLWCFVTLAVLWLTGKNSGEAARLWIFLMPWLLWVSSREPEITAKIVNGPGQTLPEYTGTPARGWLLLMILQAVVCTATVSRVDGFHFTTTVPIDVAPLDGTEK
ncbi:MAG: hypothetical protein IAG10_24245 [Planctomycetaceae bacterium]|nr:hypothetical protein [Planctomycetaceae bacterium]